MNDIYSKLFFRKQTDEEIEIDLCLSDTPQDSDADRTLDEAFYEPWDDVQIIEQISKIEFEHKMEWGGPSGRFDEDGIIYATGLKYCYKEDDNVPEVASYPQAKGKGVRYLMLFEAEKKDTPCTLEFFFFYRDPTGDIVKLHPVDHEIDIVIPRSNPESVYVLIDVIRKENRALDCGRYYVAFRLRKKQDSYIGEPVIQYINVVPAKTKSLKVDSTMVGMDSVYSQMATLTQQKLFNEQRQAMNLVTVPINLHAAVMGEKGSGKTAFAQVLFDYYVQNGFISDGKLHIEDAAQWSEMSSLESEFCIAGGGMLYIENAASMIATETRGNKNAMVESLVRLIQENRHDTCVVLADTPERISQLLATANLEACIGQIYRLPTLNLDQMIDIAERECKAGGFILSEDAKVAMKSYLSSQPNATTSVVTKLIETMVMNMSMRVVNDTSELLHTKEMLSELKAEDVPHPQVGRYQMSMDKLNELVGLKKLKYNIESHLNLVRFAQLRRQNGLKATMPPLHMIFTGNPGTGKTTVANLLGEIYASLGILKTGQVIAVDRKKLVGQYIGDTEDNTKRYLQQAHGNILFIDEAYTLVADPDDKKDFGPKVLDCLLEELSKESTDMIIILAGYPDEMEKMLHSNKGLKSRFPYTFHFEDYTEEELMEIAVLTAQSSGYTLSDEAMKKLRKLVHREMEHTSKKNRQHFGNARFITRLISSQIIPNMSCRVLGLEGGTVSPQLLSRIEAADIPVTVDNTDYAVDEAALNKALKQLDEMVGLEQVKQTLHNMVSLARTKQQQGEDLNETIPLQWTFTGATGTGKSSVAGILAQILYAFHLLSSDRMTQLRMPLTANGTWTSYDIDRILRDTMKQSGQGLLFIDLDDVANSHINVQWLRCKLTSLTAEMPGSYAFVIAVDDTRFPESPIDMPLSTSVLHFADYTADELMAILRQRLSKNGYTITDEAAAEVLERIRTLCSNRSTGFANARTIRHLYTAITSATDLRMSAQKEETKHEITKEDVTSIKWKQIPSNHIGFGA